MKLFLINLFFLLSLTASAAHAAKLIEDVLIAAKVPYVIGAGAAEKMTEASCDWGVQIAKDLVKEAKNKAKFSDEDLSGFNGRKLFLFVNNSDDGSEASKKAVKWLGVSGQLYDQNKLIGDFAFQESVYSGSLKDCKNVTYMSSGFGSSIASWLEAPSRMTFIAPKMLAKPDSINESIVKDCQWDSQIPKNLVDWGNGSIGYLPSNDLGTDKRVIKLLLTDSYILAGGVYTGIKYLEVAGTLYENNVKIGDYSGRGTGGGWTTCGVLGDAAWDLAKSIGKWLKTQK